MKINLLTSSIFGAAFIALALIVGAVSRFDRKAVDQPAVESASVDRTESQDDDTDASAEKAHGENKPPTTAGPVRGLALSTSIAPRRMDFSLYESPFARRLAPGEKRRLDDAGLYARTAAEASWMDANGFPRDYDFDRWDRNLIEDAASKGDIMAKNMLLLLKARDGSQTPLQFQVEARTVLKETRSAYTARVLAMDALGLLREGTKPNYSDFWKWYVVGLNMGDNEMTQLYSGLSEESRLNLTPLLAAAQTLEAAEYYAQLDRAWMSAGWPASALVPRRPLPPEPPRPGN